MSRDGVLIKIILVASVGLRVSRSHIMRDGRHCMLFVDYMIYILFVDYAIYVLGGPED